MVVVELGILLIALIVLSKSADVVVEKAAALATFFGISQLAIGFLLVSVSTSLPELSVSLLSSTGNHGAIAAGNVFGSNITNILLVLGLGGFLYGFKVRRSELKDIAIVLVVTSVISAYIIFNSIMRGQALGFLEGVILILLFALYAVRLTREKPFDGNGERVTKQEALRAFLLFCGAIVLVLVSASFVVDSAVKLVSALGVAESFIGATLIAVGTSLPELTIDLKAIRKKRYGIAIGDAVGSNMVNLTLVLGAASLLNPIAVNLPVFLAALLFAIATNVLFFYTAAVEQKLGKRGGALFLALYAAYIATIFILQASELQAP